MTCPRLHSKSHWQTRNRTLTRGDGMPTGDRAGRAGRRGLAGHLGVFSGGAAEATLGGTVVLRRVGRGHPAVGLWFSGGAAQVTGGCSQVGWHRPPWGSGSQAGRHRPPWVGLWFSGGVVSSLWTWEPQRLGPAQLLCSGSPGLQQRSVIRSPAARACMFWGSERTPCHQGQRIP